MITKRFKNLIIDLLRMIFSAFIRSHLELAIS